MSNPRLEEITNKILAAYNKQVERNHEVVASNREAFAKAMEAIQAVCMQHPGGGVLSLPAALTQGGGAGAESATAMSGVNLTPPQPRESQEGRPPALPARVARQASGGSDSSRTGMGSALVHNLLGPPPDTPAAGLMPHFSPPPGRSSPMHQGGSNMSAGSSANSADNDDRSSSYSQMNVSGLPPRVRRKRRSLLGGYPATSFRRSGGYFSEGLERALHGFKQYLTRYHVSSFTGQRLSETTVHYRVAAIRRLLIASGRNDLGGELVDDLRRVCGEDRNALNAVADFHSFLLHHYQPPTSAAASDSAMSAMGGGGGGGLDFKPAAVLASGTINPDNGRGEVSPGPPSSSSPSPPPANSATSAMDEGAGEAGTGTQQRREREGESDRTPPPPPEPTSGSGSSPPPPSLTTPSVSSLFPSLPSSYPSTSGVACPPTAGEGEDSATAMMPTAFSSSAAASHAAGDTGGGGGGNGPSGGPPSQVPQQQVQQQRMRMPPSGKELVRWMSHDSGGKVSTSTAYSYGRYLMYDLLPRAGYNEDPKASGGAMAAAEGLRAFVLENRASIEAMLPPCRLPYPRERAAWKLLFEFASGERIWEEEGDFWSNRGVAKKLKAQQLQVQQQQQLQLQLQPQQPQPPTDVKPAAAAARGWGGAASPAAASASGGGHKGPILPGHHHPLGLVSPLPVPILPGHLPAPREEEEEEEDMEIYEEEEEEGTEEEEEEEEGREGKRRRVEQAEERRRREQEEEEEAAAIVDGLKGKGVGGGRGEETEDEEGEGERMDEEEEEENSDEDEEEGEEEEEEGRAVASLATWQRFNVGGQGEGAEDMMLQGPADPEERPRGEGGEEVAST